MPQNILRIPADNAAQVWMRYSRLPRSTLFAPTGWPPVQLADKGSGWYEIDLSTLALADGEYEYDFVTGTGPNALSATGTADPYAPEITRYAGYRGVFRIVGRQRVLPDFDWSTEPDLMTMPGNNQLVIYELPMRWVDSSGFDKGEGYARQVGLGTFDKALYEQLDAWKDTGINAIELTPVQDSSDTLNWGYGTRFFFAPDYDMGEPYDLKMFILECHKKGIRIILDVVMNHSRNCPLEYLAYDHYYLRNPDDPQGYFLPGDKAERESRPDWGGKIFRYGRPVDGVYRSREFHYLMARYWIGEYHVDGFRLDEFKGIDNWDFIRDFTANAYAENEKQFPGRPFIVIAEDSWRRAQITYPNSGARIVDAIWDFDFQSGLRQLVTNSLTTELGKPAGGRKELVAALITGNRVWSEGDKNWRGTGFDDLAKRIIYPTSHDVEANIEQRLWGYLLPFATAATGDISVTGFERNQTALEMQVSAFALTCTAVGIPMFLAGEEFAEAHDVAHSDWQLKMSDVVDWYRRDLPGHKQVFDRVKELVQLRCSTPSLQQNGIRFFALNNGFHPTFNDNTGERVFCYCRTGGADTGHAGQVIVVANCSSHPVLNWTFSPWPWQQLNREAGGKGQALPLVNGGAVTMSLDPFQVRVFLS